MRAFIAIELSDDIRSTLSQIQSRLKYSGADIKWVEEKNIHLTLKFLGEINEDRCKKIIALLDDIGRLTRPFEINLKDIGTFPDMDNPKVIWVGLDRGAVESKLLAERIDDALAGIGFEKESRQFAAHLTIGRARSQKNKEALKQTLSTYSLKLIAGPQLIDHITLFQSTLTPKGPVYTKLHESRLK